MKFSRGDASVLLATLLLGLTLGTAVLLGNRSWIRCRFGKRGRFLWPFWPARAPVCTLSTVAGPTPFVLRPLVG